jgi:hypothetical protein
MDAGVPEGEIPRKLGEISLKMAQMPKKIVEIGLFRLTLHGKSRKVSNDRF